MTGKDFAHIEAVADEGVEDERPVRHTSIVLAAVIVMAAFSGGFWLGRDQGAEIASSQDKARLQALIQKQKKELENLRLVAKHQHKADDVSMTQVGELMFYNDLPNQSVTPSALQQADDKKRVTPAILRIRDMIHQEMVQQPMLEEAQPAMVQPIHTLKATSKKYVVKTVLQNYQIQLASFQKNVDAEKFAKKMDAKGVNTRIQEMQLPQLGAWYRVFTGNFRDRKQAKKEMLRLKETIHVTGLVVTR